MIAAADNLNLPVALSDRESHLLAAFFAARYDLSSLAEREHLTPLELLAFATSAAVQSAIAQLHEFASAAFELRALHARAKAVDILEQVAKSASDPVEKRRAASAVIRGLHRSTKKSREHESPGGIGLRPVPHCESGSIERERPTAAHPFSPPSDTDAAFHRAATIVARKVEPAPDLSHQHIVEHILDALPNAAAAIHPFLTESATIAGDPAPDEPAMERSLARIIPASRVQHIYLGKPCIDPRSEHRVAFCAELLDESDEPTYLSFILTRSTTGPHPGCWLLEALDRDTS
jgi:hypothetical protein